MQVTGLKFFGANFFLSHLGLVYPFGYSLVSKAMGCNVACNSSLKVFLTELMAIFVLVFIKTSPIVVTLANIKMLVLFKINNDSNGSEFKRCKVYSEKFLLHACPPAAEVISQD